MGAFWSRLLGCERRTERFLRTIRALQVQLRAAQQQLAQLRGRVVD
jgi:hypothetical protein